MVTIFWEIVLSILPQPSRFWNFNRILNGLVTQISLIFQEEWKAKQPKYQLKTQTPKPAEEPAPVTSSPAASQTPTPSVQVPEITKQQPVVSLS